jgi:hypothetical protein
VLRDDGASKVHQQVPQFSTAFVLDLTRGQVTSTDEQVAEIQKVLNDIITENLVKFKFASCRQELTSIKQQKERDHWACGSANPTAYR